MTTTDDDGLSAFLNVRARLFGIAYRVLRCAAAAEDVVQDVWLRWQSTNRCVVRDPAAFLTTTATRLAINVKQSARSRRETSAAAWAPEPVDAGADQVVQTERADALTLGAFVLLERLLPAQRAAYVLREAFDYSYRDIAAMLSLQEANARQLVSRARFHLARGPRTQVLAADHRRLLTALSLAARVGDAGVLRRLFALETRRHACRRSVPPATIVTRSARRQHSATS